MNPTPMSSHLLQSMCFPLTRLGAFEPPTGVVELAVGRPVGLALVKTDR